MSRVLFCAMRRTGAWISYLALVLLAGCGSSGFGSLSNMKLGDRPFIYPNGPGDSPETIENRAGVIGKKREAPPAPPPREALPPAAGGPPPAQVASRGDTPGGARERPATVAQAAPSAQASAAAPGGYTQAARYGDLLFISGQIGMDPRTGTFEDASIEVQTQRALDNVRAILESNHLTMANIVSVTVYLSNLGNLVAMDRAYQPYFRQSLPARSVVEVAKLPRGALIEISAIAGR